MNNQQPQGTAPEIFSWDDKDANNLNVIDNDNTDKIITSYPVSQEGLDAFSAKYQQPFKRREEQAKSQIGTYDYQLDDNGNIQLIPNQQEVKVSTKTTNTQSEKGTESTTKKTTAPIRRFKGVPQGGF